MNIHELLRIAALRQASDLHLSTNLAPRLRIQGMLETLPMTPYSQSELYTLLNPLLLSAKLSHEVLDREQEFAYSVPEIGRFRISLFRQQQGLSASIRLITHTPPTLDSLQLPPIFRELCNKTQGMILISGPTGSGKSSSLAAMVQHINQTQKKHIITLEDPIEFIHNADQSLISQRQLYRDTSSFEQGLHTALRTDPDIILLGELRDLTAIRLALTAAETGHLVLSTLHTANAPQAIERLIDVFPGNEKDAIRATVADCLSAVIAQKLIPHKNKRRAIFEIFIATPATRALIREHKTTHLYSILQTNQSLGMCTFEQYSAMLPTL